MGPRLGATWVKMPVLFSVQYVSSDFISGLQESLTEICVGVTRNWVGVCSVEIVEDDVRMRDLNVGL